LTISNEGMETVINTLLSRPVPSLSALVGRGTVCPDCGKGWDVYGDHILCCKANAQKSQAHNCLRDVVGTAAKHAGYCPSLEQRLVELGVPTVKPGKKMDVVFSDENAVSQFVDVSIRHPIADRYFPQSSRENGLAIRRGESEKNSKYRREIEQAGHTFRPAIAETGGRLSEEYRKLFGQFAQHRAATAGKNAAFVESRLIDRNYKRVACTIQKYTKHSELTAPSNVQMNDSAGWFNSGWGSSHHWGSCS
jgi:hypothetical protein